MKCKLKVEREFRDKNTNKVHKVGKILTADEARAKELLAHPQGIVSVVEMPNTRSNDKSETSDEAGDDGDNKSENEPENEDGDKNDEGKSSE